MTSNNSSNQTKAGEEENQIDTKQELKNQNDIN
jgi:hypothetical protein